MIEFSECISLWDEANPQGWDADDSTGSTADDPDETFFLAAFNAGTALLFAQDAVSNGVTE